MPEPLEYATVRVHKGHTPWLDIASRYLLIGAFLLYGAALVSPAMENYGFDGWATTGAPMRGWMCLILGVVYWPSNLLLLVSPGAAVLVRRAAIPTLQAVIVGLYIASTSGVCALPISDREHMLIGSWLWMASHILVTLSLFLRCLFISPLSRARR